MGAKKIAALAIFLIFTVTLILQIGAWASRTTEPDHLEKGAGLLVDAVTPWWLGIVEWFIGLGAIATPLMVGLFIFISWTGEYT